MEDIKSLTPVNAEEEDNITVKQTPAGAIRMELTPVSEALSSTLIDMKQLTLAKGDEADRKLVTQTKLGETSVELKRTDETIIAVPDMVSTGFGDQKHVPLSNEDAKEKISGGNSPNLPLMIPNSRDKKKAQHATSSSSKGRDKKKTVDPAARNATSSTASDNSKTPIWFTLLAFQDQDTDTPLPQIPSRYLRVKDNNLPVSYIQKYVAMKLNLESEDEVELYLRSLPLDPSTLLCDLLRYWIETAQPRRITTSVGASGADYMLVLSYCRKPQPKSP